MDEEGFKAAFFSLMGKKNNPYHPMVWINGAPEIGERVFIGFMSEINAKDVRIVIGEGCDIASFVTINAADSHKMTIGISNTIDRRDIIIEDHVFIGSHCAILGGTHIGSRSVIAAGTVLRGEDVPPHSLVIGNPAIIKTGYYDI